jgi:5'-3' exonuclease
MLLDTASLYFRAYFGVPDSFRGPDGTPVNALRGLLDFISRLLSSYHPSHLACCWDNDWRPRWRVDLIPSYKAHRVAKSGDTVLPEMAKSAGTSGEVVPEGLAVQVPLILAVLDALGIAVVGKGGYEADDVIGTLASIAPMPVDVVTGDRDLFQLVDDERQVRVLYTARGVGKHDVVDNAWVQQKYGIPAAGYVDYATMRGDASDGLPGISGVGDKTAATLLNSYGNLEGILAAASGPKPKISSAVAAKLRGAIDYLAVAPTVVAVVRDLDLGVSFDDDLRCPTTPAKPELFADLTELLNLGGSAERVLASLANDP